MTNSKDRETDEKKQKHTHQGVLEAPRNQHLRRALAYALDNLCLGNQVHLGNREYLREEIQKIWILYLRVWNSNHRKETVTQTEVDRWSRCTIDNNRYDTCVTRLAPLAFRPRKGDTWRPLVAHVTFDSRRTVWSSGAWDTSALKLKMSTSKWQS